MEVIGAGYGRTGTLSLRKALATLGYDPCYHMEDVFGQPSHFTLWERAFWGELSDWDEIFAKYKACTDFPACIYFQELFDRYPHAKVVLTVRDPERWYDSTYETIYLASINTPPRFKYFLPRLYHFQKMVERLIWNGHFNGRFEDRAAMIDQFNAHTEAVKASIPPEKLLVFHVKQGWEPLCAFLKKPIPNVPFPHANERKMMKRRIQAAHLIGSAVPIVALLIVITLIWLLIRLLT